MLRKRYILVVLGVISVLLGGLFYNNVILAQSGGEYDPWLDYNEDGTIDVNDLYPLGQSYGSSGDPTRTVYIKHSTYYWFTTVYIEPEDWWSCYNSTQGYKQVTLVFVAPYTDVDVALDYCFPLDGVGEATMDDFTVIGAWFETYNASRSPLIHIAIYNPSTTVVASVDIIIYMTT